MTKALGPGSPGGGGRRSATWWLVWGRGGPAGPAGRAGAGAVKRSPSILQPARLRHGPTPRGSGHGHSSGGRAAGRPGFASPSRSRPTLCQPARWARGSQLSGTPRLTRRCLPGGLLSTRAGRRGRGTGALGGAVGLQQSQGLLHARSGGRGAPLTPGLAAAAAAPGWRPMTDLVPMGGACCLGPPIGPPPTHPALQAPVSATDRCARVAHEGLTGAVAPLPRPRRALRPSSGDTEAGAAPQTASAPMAAQDGMPEAATAAATAAAEAPRAGASEGGLAVRWGCTCFLPRHCITWPPLHFRPLRRGRRALSSGDGGRRRPRRSWCRS